MWDLGFGLRTLPPALVSRNQPAQHSAVQDRRQTGNSCGGFGFPPASPWPLARPTRAVPLNPALSGSCAVEIHPVSEVSPRLVTEAPPARTPSLGQHPATSLLHVTHSSQVVRAYPSRCSPKLAGCVLLGSKVLEGTLRTVGVPPFPLSRCEVDLKLIHPFLPRGHKCLLKVTESVISGIFFLAQIWFDSVSLQIPN